MGVFRVKNVQMFVVVFHLSLCLNFLEIRSWEQIGCQHTKMNNSPQSVLVKLSVLTTFSLGVIACGSIYMPLGS